MAADDRSLDEVLASSLARSLDDGLEGVDIVRRAIAAIRDVRDDLPHEEVWALAELTVTSRF